MVQTISILCDIRACLIMFSPNKYEPIVWPSIETASGLLDHFFSLPEAEKKKYETNFDSYIEVKKTKMNEQLMKTQKKNMNNDINQLMDKLRHGHKIDDLSLNEIYVLISFLRDKIMLCRKKLNLAQHPPLNDPPVTPFGVNFKTNTNNVNVEGCERAEIMKNIDEATKRISICTLKDNKSEYLIDQWFSVSEPPELRIYQQIGMETTAYNNNPNPINYHPYQRSISNSNPNFETELVGPRKITFYNFFGPESQPLQHHKNNHLYQGSSSNTNPNLEMEPVGSASQPLQHHNMTSNNPIIDMSQPRQCPFDYMNNFGLHNGESQIDRSINTTATNDDVCQEPNPNGTTNREGKNIDERSSDIKKV